VREIKMKSIKINSWFTNLSFFEVKVISILQYPISQKTKIWVSLFDAVAGNNNNDRANQYLLIIHYSTDVLIIS
jgi:hypothetical protein